MTSVSTKFTFKNLINLTISSERKFKQGNFKGAIEDKMQVKLILNSKSLDRKIIKKFKEELSNLYSSKYDLIFDHKLIIDELKRKEITKFLEKKSYEKYKKGDYKGAIKALRRAEKYLLREIKG